MKLTMETIEKRYLIGSDNITINKSNVYIQLMIRFITEILSLS